MTEQNERRGLLGLTPEEWAGVRRDDEQFRKRYDAAKRALGEPETYIAEEDIAVLVVNGEYVFTLWQLMTTAQQDAETRYWLEQPLEAVYAANAARSRFYHEVVSRRQRRPETGQPQLAPGEVRIRAFSEFG